MAMTYEFSGADGAAFTGNLVLLKFGDVTLGTIQSMSVNDDYGPEPISGIGDIHVYEYPPTMARHTISVEYAVLKKKTLISLGVVPENGCERLKGMELDIEIYSKTGCDTIGSVVRSYRYCSLASGSFNIQAHRVIMSNATFNARDVKGSFTGG